MFSCIIYKYIQIYTYIFMQMVLMCFRIICMYMYTCIYMYMFMHIHRHKCIYIFACQHVHQCKCIHIYYIFVSYLFYFCRCCPCFRENFDPIPGTVSGCKWAWESEEYQQFVNRPRMEKWHLKRHELLFCWIFSGLASKSGVFWLCCAWKEEFAAFQVRFLYSWAAPKSQIPNTTL